MIRETDFYCQFSSYSNERIAKATCGITSIAMVLSAKGVFNKYTNKDRNLDGFFILLNSLHKNDVPSVKRPYLIGNKNVYVTIGFSSTVQANSDDILENDGKFVPVFILFRGYDHRASKLIFSMFNLKADLIENITAEELYKKLHKQEFTYFLASIKSPYADKDATIPPSHIVVIQRAYEESGKRYLEYVDPAENTYKEAVKNITLENFDKIFNQFGTFVT